jgi:predicted KAP-like P-loop ATPase
MGRTGAAYGGVRETPVNEALDADRAVANQKDDRFGFSGIASRLAPSVIRAAKGQGIVIGIEGKWGSGKTTLLNLLKNEIHAINSDDTKVIDVAPWLNGDSSSLIMSVLAPISEALEDAEREKTGKSKKRVGKIARKIQNYGVKTTRSLVPVAGLLGNFIPGFGIAADAMEAGANVLEGVAADYVDPTALKQEISEKISAQKTSFIVVLDDLDRLEPAQAVEVVRLVRSVADFPKVAYLMSYDRKVLAHALKCGLDLDDGDLFLQKIVQLTFAIPQPEPFDLRTQFRSGAEEIYESVHCSAPTGSLLDDLASAVDREGSFLSTPREVKLALNGIRFIYHSIHSDVYFPDLCRLHLIKTSNFPLYRWLEDYLSSRSVVVTGDGRVSKDSRAEMGESLKNLLPSDEVDSSRSIWHFSNFVPGISSNDDPASRVFTRTSKAEIQDAAADRRLASPFHYRYYFALSGPKTVISDQDYGALLEMARVGSDELRTQLSKYASTKGPTGRSWLRHIIDRLGDYSISTLDASTCAGLVSALCDMLDECIGSEGPGGAFTLPIERQAAEAVSDLFRRLHQLDENLHRQAARNVAKNGKSWNWLVGHFFRREVWNHGKVRERPKDASERAFSADFVDEVLKIVSSRIRSKDTKKSIMGMPDVSSYLYGWKDIGDLKSVRTWVATATKEDEAFLNVLESLRSWAMSDRVYYPLHKDAVARFFDYDRALARLNSLATGEHEKAAKGLLSALQQSEHFS